ncbi:MAG: histidine phosphatase family protein [Actinomycetota bacterium]
MPATRLHLVRHGEVHNPDGILYGRLPNFPLSELGEQMAAAAADQLRDTGAKISRILASPLQRTMQSAKPISERYKVPIEVENQLIEPTNIFEGHSVNFATLVRNPRFLLKLYNPFTPSWGESFLSIEKRMFGALKKAWDESQGEVVLVSHQLPIWVLHRAASGRSLAHDPRKRRCDLSSITSFEFVSGELREVGYLDPARELRSRATDRGAV